MMTNVDFEGFNDWSDKELIEAIIREVETGKIYTGKVVKVEDFGCFVELWPGCEGLVHVSQLDEK